VLQLNILTGKQAGTQWMARRFPARIGRSPDSDLALAEEGVWDRHLEIDLRPAQGFSLTAQSGALTSINSVPVEQAHLRNGDIIDLGAVKMRFGLSPTRHRSLRLREALTWIALGVLCIGQVALIYWLPG